MSAQDGALPNGFGRGRRIALQNAGNASIFEKNVPLRCVVYTTLYRNPKVQADSSQEARQ